MPDIKTLEIEAKLAGETDWVKYFNQQGQGFLPSSPKPANLRLVRLPSQHLPRAQLAHAKLEGAFLYRAQLQATNLWDAQLQAADLSDAQLQAATLWRAGLQAAILKDAELQAALLETAIQSIMKIQRNDNLFPFIAARLLAVRWLWR